jgi:hypothetical protein
MAMINTATVIKTPPANCQGCPHDATGLCYNAAITAEQKTLNCQQKVVIKGLIKGYFNNG